MRFPADGARYGEKFVLLGVGILKFIDHCHRESRTIAAANTSPLSLRSAESSRLKCHQNPIRHGGVFHALLFRGFSQCAGDHQIADRQWFCKQLSIASNSGCRGVSPPAFVRSSRNAGRIFPATLATDNCWSLLCPGADLVDPFSLIATVKLARSIPEDSISASSSPTASRHCVLPYQYAPQFARGGKPAFHLGRRCFDNRRFALQITINIASNACGPFQVSKTTWAISRGRGSSGDARNRRRPGSVAETHLNQLLLKQHTGFKGIQVEHAWQKP